ncbi:BCCT family transporter, partial [Stenotrophomonas maltophilia]|uniref:BCCT family transporter n=1 Tax=Stenotrophomonas maltophilia TaxID=40324 RepID=UPI0019546A08
FAVIGLIFLGDVWLGLHAGIRNAARFTFILMLITSGFLLIVGPTLFILNITLDATGIWLTNLPRLALYT